MYIAIGLTAMQVGLATESLAQVHAFQSVSYGFTMFSILGPLIAASIVMLQFRDMFLFNWAKAVNQRNTVVCVTPPFAEHLSMLADLTGGISRDRTHKLSCSEES